MIFYLFVEIVHIAAVMLPHLHFESRFLFVMLLKFFEFEL